MLSEINKHTSCGDCRSSRSDRCAKVFQFTRAAKRVQASRGATSEHRYSDARGNLANQLHVVALADAVALNIVDEDLARTGGCTSHYMFDELEIDRDAPNRIVHFVTTHPVPTH